MAGVREAERKWRREARRLLVAAGVPGGTVELWKFLPGEVVLELVRWEPSEKRAGRLLEWWWRKRA